MENKEIVLNITLTDLKRLLYKQMELTAEAVVKVAHQITIDGKTDTAVIRNEAKNARFPSDIDVLDKYFK